MRVKPQPIDGQPAYVLVFDIGDEVIAELTAFANERDITGAHFTAIGAFRDVTLGYWRWDAKDYTRIPIAEQVEVLALVGNVARDEAGKPKIHAHVVLGKSDGSAHGGHLLEARVRPTLELILREEPNDLVRQLDPETGLALLAP